jgi:hypothetical protein
LDAHIHVERDEKTFEALLAEARQLSAHEIRHVRRRDAERLGRTASACRKGTPRG